MKLQYDHEVDAFYVRFTEDKIVESEEVRPGIVFDFDSNGRIVGIEVLGAKDQISPAALRDIQAA